MNLSRIFLAVGIAVVFAVFIAYGLSVVYESPKYDYSQNDCYLRYDCYKSAQECEKRFANGTNVGYPTPLPPEYRECYANITQTPEYMSCQQALDKCNEEFEKQSPQYAYGRNMFFLLLIFGVAAIAGGTRITNMEGVSSGFIGGGILLTLWAVISSLTYLYRFDKYFKLVGLGIALVILIFVAYKKMDNDKK